MSKSKEKEYDVLGVKKQDGFAHFYLFLDGHYALMIPDNVVAWKINDKAVKVTACVKKRLVKGKKEKSVMTGVTIIGSRDQLESLMLAIGINLPYLPFGFYEDAADEACPEVLDGGFGSTLH